MQKDQSLLQLLTKASWLHASEQFSEVDAFSLRLEVEEGQKELPNYNLSHYLPAQSFTQIPHFVENENFISLFHTKSEPQLQEFVHVSANKKIAAYFHIEKNENLERAILLNACDFMSIRTGFFTHERDIFETISLGFRAMTMHTQFLDPFLLQYYTEIGRDLKINIIFVANNKTELDKILETDAPYVLLWPHCEHSFAPQWPKLIEMASSLPRSCIGLTVYPKLTAIQCDELLKYGIRGSLGA